MWIGLEDYSKDNSLSEVREITLTLTQGQSDEGCSLLVKIISYEVLILQKGDK